jgi:hypothetical protein
LFCPKYPLCEGKLSRELDKARRARQARGGRPPEGRNLRPSASLGRTGRVRITPDWREICAQSVVLVLALAVVSVWVYTKPIVFSQDTLTYIHHARELQLRTALPGALFPRTPGFPLIAVQFPHARWALSPAAARQYRPS